VYDILDRIFCSTAAKIASDVLFQLNIDQTPLLHHLWTDKNASHQSR